MKQTITAAHVLTQGEQLRRTSIEMEVAEPSQPSSEGSTHHFPGATIAPAFFDVHTHGCRGRDVMEASGEALGSIGRFLAQHGVGAYLPTTITASKDATLRSLAGLAKLIARAPQPGEARPLGIHLEGPFLAHSRRGAHPPDKLLEPSIPFFNAMWEAAEGRVVLMTLAPELPGALELIAHAVALGVRVSIGHSDGGSAAAYAAMEAGASSATHTFNAMRGLTQREPGIAGAVLTSDSLYAELICDGLHVDPAIVKLFARAKPADRAILVTDAMSAAGMPDGTYTLGELDVRVTAGRCITGVDTLAGSTLTMDRALVNYMRYAGVPLDQALLAGTRNPAHMAGLEHLTGVLVEKQPADVNVFSPSGELLATFLRGELVPRAQ